MQQVTPTFRQFRAAIGRNIHTQRLKRRLPISRLAQLSGLSEWQIDHYELGKGEIRLSELHRLAQVMHVRVEALIAV